MATRPTNKLRQIYDVRGGVIDIKIVTESGLSAEEIEAFEGVIKAVNICRRLSSRARRGAG
jgi:hypothetical protein